MLIFFKSFFSLTLQPIFEDMIQFYEEEKTIRRIERRFNKGVVQYGLIEEGQNPYRTVGRKDSLAL